MRIAMIGAGLAGAACGTRLSQAGHVVALFDKGRGAGGRMASRRAPTAMGEAGFDHGAQYFTAREPAFRAQVDAWAALGLAARWPAAGPEAWVGAPAMNAPVRHLAQELDVRWGARVERLARVAGKRWRLLGADVDESGFDAVLTAVPAEQARPLLSAYDAGMAGKAAAARSMPCWTLMVAFAGRVPCEADVLREGGAIGWAARNSAKPGRGGPEAWVVQAGPDWSVERLEDSADEVRDRLLRAFAERLGAALPDVLAASVHRWRFARAGALGESALWSAELGLGACGDWLLGPRVECAWLSGVRLAQAVGAPGQSG